MKNEFEQKLRSSDDDRGDETIFMYATINLDFFIYII